MKSSLCCIGTISISLAYSVSKWTNQLLLYPPFNEVERGVYWFHLVCLSVCLSIGTYAHLSVCRQNRFCSVSSTILTGSISFLHILASNSRKCVMSKVYFKVLRFEVLTNSLDFKVWLCHVFTWYPILIISMGNHAAAAGILRMQTF